MPPCSGQSRPSPAGGREDAASLDRPCARRLRELAVGMEEYSRRGSNQRMRPKRARKPTISNCWFSGNFRLALTLCRGERPEVLKEPYNFAQKAIIWLKLQFIGPLHSRRAVARCSRCSN